MPEIVLPEVRLPEVDLSKIKVPDVDRSKVDLSKVDVPKALEDGRKAVEDWASSIDLSKIGSNLKAAPDTIAGRRRSNPILPIAVLIAVLSAMAATVWLINSPSAGPRIRSSADRAWRKVRGQETAVERFDDADDLASLLPDRNGHPSGSQALADASDAIAKPMSDARKKTTDAMSGASDAIGSAGERIGS